MVDHLDEGGMVLRTVYLPRDMDDALRWHAFRRNISKGAPIRELLGAAMVAPDLAENGPWSAGRDAAARTLGPRRSTRDSSNKPEAAVDDAQAPDPRRKMAG